MSQFLKKVFFFIVTTSLLFGLILYGTSRFISTRNYFNIPKNISSLVLGHSQSACSLKDSFLNGFYNLSENGEGYPYSYFKSKKILENNAQIKNIFIEYTNNQLGEYANNRIYGEYIDINVSKNIPVLTSNFIFRAFWKNKNPIKIAKTLSQALTSNVSFILGEDSNYIESKWHNYEVPNRIYTPTNKISFFEDKFTSFKSKIKKIASPLLFHDVEKKDVIESINIEYLKKLLEICNDNGVNLYFIRSPLPSGTTFANENLFKETLKNEFKDVTFLDFKEFPLQNNKFADHLHLNRSGQKEFTLFFKRLIEEGVLCKSNPQDLINSKMINYQIDKEY